LEFWIIEIPATGNPRSTTETAEKNQGGFSSCVQGEQVWSVLPRSDGGTSIFPDGTSVDEVPDGAMTKGLRLFESALKHKIGQLSVLEFG
jgi:hypothetical protein